MKQSKNPLRRRRQLWPLVIIVTLLTLTIYLLVVPISKIGPEFLMAVMSGILGTVFFLHRGHADDARFMRELFEYFNDRYDKQNNNLQAILEQLEESDQPLCGEQKGAFIDYFNLCAEESVFNDAGYIYDRVWESWENGMRQFGKNKQVAVLWELEESTNSYYGFRFPTG